MKRFQIKFYEANELETALDLTATEEFDNYISAYNRFINAVSASHYPNKALSYVVYDTVALEECLIFSINMPL